MPAIIRLFCWGVRISKTDDSLFSKRRSIDAWDRIAKYTDPKLKAVDYYHEEDRVINVVVKRFDLWQMLFSQITIFKLWAHKKAPA
jgi:hypothetical protein